MQTTHIPTLQEMTDFVSGSVPLSLKIEERQDAYNYCQKVLVKTVYRSLRKKDKSTVRQYLQAITGYSRAQTDRLISQYVKTGHIALSKRTQPTFSRIYTNDDIVTLAVLDELFEHMSGPATAVVCQDEYRLFGNEDYVRLQHISSAQIYRLRDTMTYRNHGVVYARTRPTKIPIGERVKPEPDGQPGYIRVDSVHQGDKDGEKGVYHINLVDEVTQWQVTVSVEGISERFLILALELAFKLFPFKIINFHSDNGSEYINHKVAGLLENMQAKLTKSRPRRSGDNGLVETKNGATIRKALGYTHIPRTSSNVATINQWYVAWYIPWLNFHRPSAFRETKIDEKSGKIKHTYPAKNYMTPCTKLTSLDEYEQYLQPGITLEHLETQAYAMSRVEWTKAMQDQKIAMWNSLTLEPNN